MYRTSAILAAERVQESLKWERCKESSSMFKDVAEKMNEEFDRVTRGEKFYRKRPIADVAVVGILPPALSVDVPV